MTAGVFEPLGERRPAHGGVPARRAVVRWAWRLFRREWRQQFLILALITVAVLATIVGSAVATNTPPLNNSGFGTAQDSVFFSSYDAHAASVIARLEHRFGRVELIENETLSIPGSINTYQLRAQDLHGPFSGPMLSLVSGSYPSGADQVAVTRGVASDFHLTIGSSWRVGGVERKVVGIVENPQSLLDEFALVPAGEMTNPTEITALFDAPGVALSSIGNNVQTPASVAQSNPINPETISLAALVLGMLLITLVSVGGFTVLAQRRLRSIGMLESTGATDRHVRLVVRANGTVVGIAGAILGFVLGLRRLARLPSEPRTVSAPRHRSIRPLVDRGRSRDGARGRGGPLRRVPSGTSDHQGADRPSALGPTGASSSDPPIGAPWHWLPRCRLPPPRLLGC